MPLPPSATQPTDEFVVALCIYGVEINPADITFLLGTNPTHAHSRGEQNTLNRRPSSKGSWILELRHFAPVDPNWMFEELFARVSQEEAVWRQLASLYEIRVDFAAHTDCGLTVELSSRTVQRIAQIHANFQIFIQAYCDNDRKSHP